MKRNHWKELDHTGRADYCYSFRLNTDTEKEPSNSYKSNFTIKDDHDLLTLLLFNRCHQELITKLLVH